PRDSKKAASKTGIFLVLRFMIHKFDWQGNVELARHKRTDRAPWNLGGTVGK
ncbi:hypothetical protein FRC01_011045, partial [Tulasnella sp. 417]